MDTEKLDFIVAGVGGQGTILASDILAEVGVEAGYVVKKSEVHGMSQRGGSVESHVRWGKDVVYSPLAEKGNVDYLLGFEMLEAARWRDFVAPWGTVIVNEHKITPSSVNLGHAIYPERERINDLLKKQSSKVTWVEATLIAKKLGHPALAGVIILGALSKLIDIGPGVWLSVVERLVPARFVELNREAFLAGRNKQQQETSA